MQNGGYNTFYGSYLPSIPIQGHFKVEGSSLLIQVFAYSLFVGIYLVVSNMAGYSHSCHSIKLIHWGAPERDVLSNNMVL